MKQLPKIFKPIPPMGGPQQVQRAPRRHGRFLAVLLAFFAVGLGAGLLLNWSSDLPSIEQLENIEPNLVTRILSADSILLKEYYIERRFAVPLNKIPDNLVNAVIATEDREYYRHWGMNLKRLAAALVTDIMALSVKQGASTITQQLSRSLFLKMEKTLGADIVRKVKEAMTAIQIERRYTKQEILEFYLNQIYLGGGVYGVQAASQKFFGKNVQSLNLSECALIAATIKTPEKYRPDKVRNLARARYRRGWVLKSMKEIGAISGRTYQKALNLPIVADTTKKDRTTLAPYFTESVRQYIEKKYSTKALYTGGLTVYTTLYYKSQRDVEDSIKLQLREIQVPINAAYVKEYNLHKKLDVSYDFLKEKIDSLLVVRPDLFPRPNILPDTAKDLRVVQAALISLDTKDGAILAMVGGRNFKESKFNRATQAMRQPGSAFKPFVYTGAIDSGFTVVSTILDQPISLESHTGTWRPENYSGKFFGEVTLKDALRKSMNIATIRLINSISPRVAIKYARRMGITHPLHPVPALAIGVCEVTPLEITAAYSVLANLGTKSNPYLVKRILDKDGNVLEDHVSHQKEVLDPKTAFIMIDLLKHVILRGTGARTRSLGFTRPAGGKTGTTNDYTDAWFVGFTPQITCGVWVGIDEKHTLGNHQTGSKAAIPIWTTYMKSAHDGLPFRDFTVPAGIEKAEICEESHLVARTTCKQITEEFFIDNTIPQDSCDIPHFQEKPGKAKSIRLF